MSYARNDDMMQVSIANQLPAIIRRRRTERGFSQHKLAELINCVPGTVQNWESGKTMPDAASLALLNQVLGEKFVNDFLCFSGHCGAYPADGNVPPPQALAEISRGVTCMAEALADGRIDHTEYPSIFNALGSIITFAQHCQNELKNRFGTIC